MDIFGPSNVGWKVSDDGKTVTLLNRKWDNGNPIVIDLMEIMQVMEEMKSKRG